MSSTNSTYEERITSKENEERITSIDHVRNSVWKECLITEAGLSIEMARAAHYQADSDNYHKPIGLFFDRIDWVVNQDSEFREKLATGSTTKQGSLIESFYYYGRECPLMASIHWDGPCDFDIASKDLIVDTAVDVLVASELDEQEQVRTGPYSNLRDYVASLVDTLERDLDIPNQL